MLTLVELIAKKRDGHSLTEAEIRRVIDAFGTGAFADYQMSALLMAIFQRGMTDTETNALTDAMLRSGHIVDLSSAPGIKVDKHSTGGVGDKVSLCLAPLVAACGVPVPMVSGRGLGHTGGTLDKLEAIPGFRVTLSVAEFQETLRTVGCAMSGQTDEIAPADRRLYALRDVTATVESIPLIVASILSKKLAEGADALVLDVKVGKGAFMKETSRAYELAHALVRVGKRAGKQVVALLTDMSVPLGRTIGNALETREALEVLHGRGPGDVVACTFALGTEMLILGGKAQRADQGYELLHQALKSGAAAGVMRRLIAAQGGDARVVDEPDRLPRAPAMREVFAEQGGWVHGIDPWELGQAAVVLGAGRTRADQPIDASVGIELTKQRGDKVEGAGSGLARIWARDQEAAEGVAKRIQNAFLITDAPPEHSPLVIDRVVLFKVWEENRESKIKQ